MNFRFNTLFTALFLLPISIFAQKTSGNIEFKRGAEINSKKTTVESILGFHSNGYILTKYEKKNMLLEKIDANLASVNKVVISNDKHEGVKKYPGSAKVIDNQLYVTGYVYDKKQGKNLLVIDERNSSDLSLKRTAKVIENIKNTEGGEKFIRFSRGFTVSRNQKFVFFGWTDDGKIKGSKEVLRLLVLNSEMEDVWENTIEIPFERDLFDLNKSIVDDEGSIHILGKLYKTKRKDRVKGEPNYTYHVVSILNGGKEIKDYEIELEGFFLKDATIGIDQKNNLVASGFYTKENKNTVKGAFYITIDIKAKKVIQSAAKDFDFEVLSIATNEDNDESDNKTNNSKKKGSKAEKKTNKKSNEMYAYRLDDIVWREDGGAILLAEQFFITERTVTTMDSQGRMTTTTTYYYNYHNILLVNITAEGEIEWLKRIDKRQVTSGNDMYLSYAFTVCKDKMYFVFNDHIKNHEKKTGKYALYYYRGPYSSTSIVSLATVDTQGNSTYEILDNPAKGGVTIAPKYSGGMKDGSSSEQCDLLLYGVKRKVYQFNLLKIK